MNHQRTLQSVVAFMLVVLSMAGCGGAPALSPTSAIPAAVETAPAESASTMPESPNATAALAATTTSAPTVTAAPMATSTRSALDRRSSTPAAAKKEMTFKRIEFTSQALAGNLLGDPASRMVFILLPPEYATSNKRYPVVYVLHGYGADSASLVTPLKLPSDRALGSDAVQDMIMVFPDAKTSLGGSWYLDSPTTGGYETYITQELVSYIDANYRTLARPESRGVTGCSMGGEGAAHLALAHPDVFSVVAAVSGAYDWGKEQEWKELGAGFQGAPQNLRDFATLPFPIQMGIGLAAVVAPNSDNPPYYADLPWVISNGAVEAVPSVVKKMDANDPGDDARRYVQQSQRLVAFMLYHGSQDSINPIELARAYDKLLTDLGIEHTFVEVNDRTHCGMDFMPVVEFMSDHLKGEDSGK